jgi:hypothetical protein
MEQSTKVNSKMKKDMVMVFRSGQMAPSMKVIGKIIRPTAVESSITLTETYTMECGRKTWLMVTVFMFILTDQNTKVIGTTISNMVMAVSNGLMEVNTMVAILTDRKMAEECTTGPTAIPTWVTG